MRHPFFTRPAGNAVLVLGHRGAAGHAPENTLASFARAIALGADIIETDLQVSRDGVAVLCHDADIARTTDGSGAIAAFDFATLRQFDAGDGEHIPSLGEALAALPNTRFNIEIKDTSDSACAVVLAEVLKSEAPERVLLTAGDDAVMARLREALAATPLSVAQGASTGDVLAFLRVAQGLAPRSALPPEPMALQIPASFQGRTLVTPGLLDIAHACGVEVHVWTVNEVSEMLRLEALGVDGLVTDYPEHARGALDAPKAPRD